MMERGVRAVGSAALPMLVVLAACGDGSTGPDASGDVTRVTLSAASVQAPVGGGAAASAAAAALVEDGEGNTLELTRVALVIREIEFERQFDECEEGSVSDDCEKFEAGPFLLELPLDGGVIAIGDIDVPPAFYDELEFEVHKPSDDTPDDLAFLESHPEFKDVSIWVEGVYNGGDPFIFLQDLNEDQEIDLVPPLEVTAESFPMNITLELDVSVWFKDSAGILVDPLSANKGGDNENLVEENIKQSIELFEDNDRDGRRDD